MSILRSNRNRRHLRSRHCTALATACTVLLGTLGLTRPAQAANQMRGDRKIGLGGGLGDPMGPSLKLFLAPQHALQFDLGWAPMHYGHGIFHANYLFHINPFVSNSVMDFGIYFGGGLGIAFWAPPSRYCGPDFDRDRCYWAYNGYYGRYRRGGAAMVIRAPFGLYFHWQKVPLDTVIEGGWSPYIIYPDLDHGDFSVKVRYYF